MKVAYRHRASLKNNDHSLQFSMSVIAMLSLQANCIRVSDVGYSYSFGSLLRQLTRMASVMFSSKQVGVESIRSV